MPGWPIRKNDSGGATLVFPIYDADGDLVTAAASLDSERSIDQGTFTDCTNEAAEIATSSGMYSLVLTQAEINGDEIATITKTVTAGAKTAPNVIYTSTRNIDDLAFPTTSGRSIDVETTGEVGLDLDNTVGTLAAAQIATDAITAAKIAADAIGSSELATDAIGAAQIAANAIGASEIADGAIDAGAFAAGAIDTAAIATDAIDADALAADAVTEIRSLVNGTSDSGTTTTMVDAVRTEADTDYFKGDFILFTSGNISGQCRLITGFTPASDTVTFSPATTQAVATQTYEILPAARVDLELWLGSVANALVSGRVDASVGAMAAAVMTAAAVATDAIDADALAADAANEIADAILKRDLDQVEATMALHSLGTACLKAVSRIVDDAGVLKTYRTDETTLHLSQNITTNPSGDPIDELSGSA